MLNDSSVLSAEWALSAMLTAADSAVLTALTGALVLNVASGLSDIASSRVSRVDKLGTLTSGREREALTSAAVENEIYLKCLLYHVQKRLTYNKNFAKTCETVW
jgi:hypothetical protein